MLERGGNGRFNFRVSNLDDGTMAMSTFRGLGGFGFAVR